MRWRPPARLLPLSEGRRDPSHARAPQGAAKGAAGACATLSIGRVCHAPPHAHASKTPSEIIMLVAHAHAATATPSWRMRACPGESPFSLRMRRAVSCREPRAGARLLHVRGRALVQMGPSSHLTAQGQEPWAPSPGRVLPWARASLWGLLSIAPPGVGEGASLIQLLGRGHGPALTQLWVGAGARACCSLPRGVWELGSGGR